MLTITLDEARLRAEQEELGYFYVINGVIPELMPRVAFRRGSQTAPERNRKILKCPQCEHRLTDVDADTRFELYQHPKRVAVQCQVYLQCVFCKTEVGIRLATLPI